MRAVDLGNIYRNRGYLDKPGRYVMEPMRIYSPNMIFFQSGFLVMMNQQFAGWKLLEEGYPVTFGSENSVEKEEWERKKSVKEKSNVNPTR